MTVRLWWIAMGELLQSIRSMLATDDTPQLQALLNSGEPLIGGRYHLKSALHVPSGAMIRSTRFRVSELGCLDCSGSRRFIIANPTFTGITRAKGYVVQDGRAVELVRFP